MKPELAPLYIHGGDARLVGLSFVVLDGREHLTEVWQLGGEEDSKMFQFTEDDAVDRIESYLMHIMGRVAR